MIAEFNRRIKINRYEFAQNSYGGNITLPVESWNIWANIETTAGNKTLDNAQINYTKSFRVRVRAERTRPIFNTDEIVYLNDILIIQSITREIEGRVNFLNIDAYTTNETGTPYTPPVDIGTVYWGYSSTPFTTGNIEAFNYQYSMEFTANADINADFTNASTGKYLAFKYPANFIQKDNWFNAEFNQGYIPDQVFDGTYEIGDYTYVFSRVIPALEEDNKIIIFN